MKTLKKWIGVLAASATVMVSVVNPERVAAGSDRAAVTVRWTSETPGDPEELLADEDGVVAVAEDGRVSALAPDGARRWTADVGHGRAVVFHDLPSMNADVVVVPANEEGVVVLDRATGSERWRYPLPGVKSSAVGRPDGSATLVALANRAGTLVVVEGATGAPRWSVTLADFDGNELGYVWFGSDALLVQWTPLQRGSRIGAFDLATGALLWDRAMDAASLPSVENDIVYFAETEQREAGPNRAEVQALDLATGIPRWSTAFETKSVYFTFATSALRGDALAFVDLDGQIRLFDAHDGRQRWKRRTRRPQYEASLRMAGPIVAMSTYGTGLLALGVDRGQPISTEPIGSVQTEVTIESTAAAGSRLYLLVSRNGPDTGTGEVWSFRATR